MSQIILYNTYLFLISENSNTYELNIVLKYKNNLYLLKTYLLSSIRIIENNNYISNI